MQPKYKLLRTASTAAVAVFLVAGAALATTSFVRSGRSADAEPAGNTTELTTSATDELETEEATGTTELETEEATETSEPDETEEASATASDAQDEDATDDHEDASFDDHGGNGEVNDDHGGDQDGDHQGEDEQGDDSGHDSADGVAGDQSSEERRSGHGRSLRGCSRRPRCRHGLSTSSTSQFEN